MLLVFAVITALCCGTVNAAPTSSFALGQIEMALRQIEKVLEKIDSRTSHLPPWPVDPSNVPDNDSILHDISEGIDEVLSRYRKVTEDAIPIVYGNIVRNFGSTSSGDGSTGSVLSGQFNSQLDTILESARLQFTAEGIKFLNALKDEDASNFSDILDEMNEKPIELEVNAKLIDLLMNSGDIVKTACDSIIEHFVEVLGFTEEKSKKEWIKLLEKVAPEIIEQINKSKDNIIHNNPVEARRLLEEHFLLNTLPPSIDD